jgi:hypothetical protein
MTLRPWPSDLQYVHTDTMSANWEGFSYMNSNRLFFISLAIALILICCLCSVLSGLMVTKAIPWATGISLLSMAVDIVIGIFTIWGLYWAALQFTDWSAKPQIKLVLGCVNSVPEDAQELHTDQDPLPPRRQTIPSTLAASLGPVLRTPKRVPGTVLDVYVTNTARKAAQSIVLTLEFRSSVSPSGYAFSYSGDSGYAGTIADAYVEGVRVSLALSDSIVLYNNQSLLWVGRLWVNWSGELIPTDLPATLTVAYKIHTLDGSNSGSITLKLDRRTIIWACDHPR